MNFVKMIINFIRALWSGRKLLWELTKKDFKSRFVGSYLGIAWAFIQPMITVCIFWFVFEVGFKAAPVQDFPFVLWLVCGLFPWFFFNDAVSAATNSITTNSYLVKKVVFKVSLLPVIQILSTLIVHIFFVAVMFVMFAIYGYYPSIYNLQLIYYLFALICFTFGLSLITSSLTVFMRDVGQAVMMLLQFGFWATPIFWSLKMIPENLHWIFKLNPLYYIINGYRISMIDHVWFWQLGYTNIGFWAVTIVVAGLGVYVFKKLRPHFADVL